MQPSNHITARSDNLSEWVYQRIKTDIFDFKLMPGERFTETEIANTYAVSRTPTRQALYRLQQEGYVDVAFRSGWTVRPLDLNYYDELYEVRIMIEQFCIQKLCTEHAKNLKEIQALVHIWMVEPDQYIQDLKTIAQLDEHFHSMIVLAAGNQELVKLHQEMTEKIRIIRRLDFSKRYRIELTYQQHQNILQSILNQDLDAIRLIAAHIQQSRDAVKKITVSMLNPLQFSAQKK